MVRIDSLKKIIFILLFFILTFLCYNCFFAINKNFSDLVYSNIITYDLVDQIFINGEQIPYDKQKNVCYVADADFLKNSKIKVSSSSRVKSFLFLLDDSYKVVVYNDYYYQVVDVIVTNIPIVNIHNLDLPTVDGFVFEKDIDSFTGEAGVDISKVAVQFFDISEKSRLYTSAVGMINVRGASSQMFKKKSYKLKFDHKINIFDIYEDDVWVMDALVADKSKIRNKLSSDLWDVINNNQTVNNDLFADYVEVFMDNKYVGLYTLKNKVNKNVTGIENDGILIKSIAHVRQDYINQLLANNFNISDDGYFLNYQIKNYNYESYKSIIYKLQRYYKKYYDVITYDLVMNNFDFENFINYKLFVLFISGSDNISYNQYLSLVNSDSNILITPWDMDLTWGLNWSDDADLHSQFLMESSSDINWINENITNNMDEKMISLLKDRYWELRKNIITMDTINGYLNSYKEELVNSGATKRDSERWYEYDIEFEIEQIREWAIRRIEFLDQYFS